jgi:hypothetical protein
MSGRAKPSGENDLASLYSRRNLQRMGCLNQRQHRRVEAAIAKLMKVQDAAGMVG